MPHTVSPSTVCSMYYSMFNKYRWEWPRNERQHVRNLADVLLKGLKGLNGSALLCSERMSGSSSCAVDLNNLKLI